MFPGSVLLNVLGNAIQLPNNTTPSLSHWGLCQLPLVQVNRKWHKALFPVVGNEAHSVLKKQTDYIIEEHARSSMVRRLRIEGNTAIMSQDMAAARPSRLVVNMLAYNGALTPLEVLVDQTMINRYAFSEVKELFIEIDTRNNAKASTMCIFETNEESEALARRMARFLPDVKRFVARTYGDDSDAWAFVKTLAETKKKNDGSFQFDTNCATPFSGWWFMANALHNKS